MNRWGGTAGFVGILVREKLVEPVKLAVRQTVENWPARPQGLSFQYLTTRKYFGRNVEYTSFQARLILSP